MIGGTCDYKNGLNLKIDIDQVAALFGGDVEGPNLQFYVLEDAREEMIIATSSASAATLNIDGLTISAVQHRKLKIKKEIFGEDDPEMTLEQVLESV